MASDFLNTKQLSKKLQVMLLLCCPESEKHGETSLAEASGPTDLEGVTFADLIPKGGPIQEDIDMHPDFIGLIHAYCMMQSHNESCPRNIYLYVWVCTVNDSKTHHHHNTLKGQLAAQQQCEEHYLTLPF